MDRSKSLLAVAMLSFMVTLSVIGWILHLAAVALGSLYLKDCPKQPYVPIFLVVTGVCTAISQLVTYLRESLKEGALSILCMVFNFLLGLFNICWFITGSVWVYSIYPPNYESPGSQEYCKKSLYLFAFWFINFCYICISLVLACGGLFVLCTCLTSVFKKNSGQTQGHTVHILMHRVYAFVLMMSMICVILPCLQQISGVAL